MLYSLIFGEEGELGELAGSAIFPAAAAQLSEVHSVPRCAQIAYIGCSPWVEEDGPNRPRASFILPRAGRGIC